MMKTTTGTSTSIDAEKNSRFFILICLLFGSDPRRSTTSLRSRLLFVACVIVNGISIYPTMTVIMSRTGRRLSLARLAFIMHILASYIIIVITIRIVGFKSAKLVQLLEGKAGKVWVQQLITVLLRTPAICYLTTEIVDSFQRGERMESFYNLCHIYLVLITTLPVLIYIELASILQQRARFIVESFDDYEIKFKDLAKEKWLIRDRTADLNSLFSNIIALSYMQFSMEAILSINSYVTVRQSSWSMVVSVSQLCALGVGFLLARQSSTMMSLLIEVEQLALKRLCAITSSGGTLHGVLPKHSCPLVQWQALRYHSIYDSLTVGCFVNNQQTFMSFLVTGITCLAVIMQFDYKVLWVVQNLADKYGRGIEAD